MGEIKYDSFLKNNLGENLPYIWPLGGLGYYVSETIPCFPHFHAFALAFPSVRNALPHLLPQILPTPASSSASVTVFHISERDSLRSGTVSDDPRVLSTLHSILYLVLFQET